MLEEVCFVRFSQANQPTAGAAHTSVTRNGIQMNVQVDVRGHINSIIHLNTNAKRQKEREPTKTKKAKTNKITLSSERHSTMDAKNKILESEKEKAKEEAKEEWFDECGGSSPDSEYPDPPKLKEQIPDNLPPAEEQEPPPEDEGYCANCGNSPCLFLQWQQEELERIVDTV
jgi:hypothetical protein